ncbi:MAG: hypothetical protein DWQ04_18395 [Chloroflexi bacterium]|nr:MAG: hypothetical protein DWQ04_18395 [Chloroflexota bacterium]
MRPLTQALHDHELIVLRVIGEWWEMDLTGTDKNASVKSLAATLERLDMVQERSFLPPEEAAAIDDLVASNGRIPVATFERTHGAVRMMGPGKLEREEPWFDPVSPAEALWYRGMLHRGFDETGEGVIEFYYLPVELFQQFPQPEVAEITDDEDVEAVPEETTQMESVAEPKVRNTAVIDAVDDVTAILAMAQLGTLHADRLDEVNQLLLNPDPERRSLLLNLAHGMEMLRETDAGIRPTRTAVSWLQQSREMQLRGLADAWSSCGWNDLCHTPELQCEGENWSNDPIAARTALLEALPQDNNWYYIADVVNHIKENNADFQRPDGNYDTWYIRDVHTDAYVKGFENWNKIEGRLLAFMIQGPLVWLGLAVTAVVTNKPAFQLTDRCVAWLKNEPASSEDVRVPLVLQPDGTLIVPHNGDRYQRFQGARICEPLPAELGKPFRYQLTPQSLAVAGEQGIAPDRILQFLEAATGRPIPAGVKRGIMRWGERGVEARLETAVILRVRDAAILDTLRNNPKTRDYIGESLGDLSATVRLEDWQPLRDAVTQLGLLLDTNI